MRDTDLTLLCCLECRGSLNIETARRDEDGDILDGLLKCDGCGQRYPILRRTLLAFPRETLASYLSPEETAAIRGLGFGAALKGAGLAETEELAQVSVSENWEYQWNEVMAYDSARLEGEGLYSAQAMRAFIPIEESRFVGRDVFIGCGGRGREAYHMHKFGAARIIVNELGREIYNIHEATGIPPHKLMLIRSDLRHLPLQDAVVDIALCDHALQHVLDHRRGFASLSRLARPGGQVAVCVYSWENNFLMTHLVEPMKGLLHLLPLKALRWLALLPASILWLVIHGVYVPASHLAPSLCKRLPLAQHFLFWSKFHFIDLWGAVFDLLHAPISHHFRKQELLDMAQANELSVQALVNTHQTLWSLVAQRPG